VHEDTFSHLKDRGYARGDAQVDRDKLADAILELLLQRTRVQEPEQIQDKAMLVSEIRYEVLGAHSDGEVEHELDTIVAPLTGPNGLVQDKLDGETVLCSGWVMRRLTNGGADVTIKRVGRFIGESDEIVDRYFLAPAQHRLVQTAKRYKGRFELSIERRPAIATRYRPQIEQAYTLLELELPKDRP
jgi:hypothetical protein